MSRFELHLGDCLETLRAMPDSSVDSIVTDPPYGLSFMGKKWDYDVPSVEIWAECLRVLKPGGHLLAFAGTRTQHRMAVRIEDAGFEIRDMIAWVYGCLSEDSEVLTEDGWMPYNRAKQKNILAYDLQNDIYQWEKPSRWNEYRVESDTAYRIQSDHTDQIVSRGHRCLVERGGMLAFVPADELAGVECLPYLRGDLSALPQGRGELLLQAVLRKSKGLAQAALSERQGEEAARQGACWGEKPGMEGRADLLQAQGQIPGSVDQVRPLPCGTDEHGPQRRVSDGASACGGAGDWQTTDAGGMCAPHQPRRDGQPAGEFDAVCDQCGSQAVRARASYQTTLATVTAIEYSGMIWCPTVSTGAFVARRNGKVFITGNSGFPKSLDVSKAIDKMDAADARRARQLRFTEWMRSTGLTSAEIDRITGTNMGGHYTTAASQPAVATREHFERLRPHFGGDVPEWVEQLVDERTVESENFKRREVLRTETRYNEASGIVAAGRTERALVERKITEAHTEAARQWQGWGTALKPALEPITVARKPLVGTVAANVLQHGTGAINVDGCRVNPGEVVPGGGKSARGNGGVYGDGAATENARPHDAGRWPANLLHDGSEEVLSGFPDTGKSAGGSRGAGERDGWGMCAQPEIGSLGYGDTGSAARFFYAAKASKRDRDEGLEGFEAKAAKSYEGGRIVSADHPETAMGGASVRANTHPTVKPTDLMAYLCRLVTPPGGLVLDPFMGSGSTGKAALREGFRFIGCEMSPEYLEIARARIESALKVL